MADHRHRDLRLYRRNQGLSLTQTAKDRDPKPVVEHEVEYQSVLVAFEDGQYSRRRSPRPSSSPRAGAGASTCW